MDPIDIVIALTAAFGGCTGVAALLSLFLERRKREAAVSLDEAAAAKQISDAAMQLVEPLRGEINALRQETVAQAARIKKLEGDNAKLDESLALALRRIDELKAEIEQLRAEVEKWKKKYFQLCNWVKRQGLSPPNEE